MHYPEWPAFVFLLVSIMAVHNYCRWTRKDLKASNDRIDSLEKKVTELSNKE